MLVDKKAETPIPFPLAKKHLVGIIVGLSIIFVSLTASEVSDYFDEKEKNDVLINTAIYTNNTLDFLKAKASEDPRIVVNATLIPRDLTGENFTLQIEPANDVGGISSFLGDGPKIAIIPEPNSTK